MAIHFVYGKPGSGKGVCVMSEIDEWVRVQQKPCITDFAVELDPWVNGLHKPQSGYLGYLQKVYHKRFSADELVFRLNPEWMGQFFRFRALPKDTLTVANARLVTLDDGVMSPVEFARHKEWRLWMADCKMKRTKDGELVVEQMSWDLLELSGPTAIFGDEVWKHWGARNWQNTGLGVIEYAKQHRHIGDEVFFASQHYKDIDAAIIRVVQDFWYCRNQSKLRISFWSRKKNIEVLVFEGPHGDNPNVKPQFTKKFSFDVDGLLQAYDTTGGSGHKGRLAGDLAFKSKGLPYWSLWLAVIVLPFLAVDFGMKLLQGGLNRKVSQMQHQGGVVSTNTVSSYYKQFDEAAQRRFGGHSNSEDTNSQAKVSSVLHSDVVYVGQVEADTNKVWCIGYVILGQSSVVYLSDGAIAYSDDDEVQEIRHHFVTVFHHRYRVEMANETEPLHEATTARSEQLSPEVQSRFIPSSVTVLPSVSGQGTYMVSPPVLNGLQNMSGNRGGYPGQ